MFRALQSNRALSVHPFKPFVLRIREGFLLGLAMPPEKGSPCLNCIQSWLTQRRVWSERMDLVDLRIGRDLIPKLIEENNSHVFYEIMENGTVTRLDSIVFPHPRCACHRGNYVPPPKLTNKLNFAFSPLFQIKCVRYSTPTGNLWVTNVTGDPLEGSGKIVAQGHGPEREVSRLRAVDEWLKRYALSSLVARSQEGEALWAKALGTNEPRLLLPHEASGMGSLGAGKDEQEALIDALSSYAKVRTLQKYAATHKSPMLIVGANGWLRDRVPFTVLQQYDLHLFFYPNSTPTWVVGVAAMSRINTSEPVQFFFGAHRDVNEALLQLVGKVVEFSRPVEGPDEGAPAALRSVDGAKASASKLHLWWTHWIYRCPKISLKDVSHLEPYEANLETWKAYFGDGQENLSYISMNHDLLPGTLKTLVKLVAPSLAAPVNVNGIGTWASFRSSLV